MGLGALQGSSLLHDNDIVRVENQKPPPANINAVAKCQMQNVSDGDGFLALSMLKSLRGGNALFVQEQYKVLLGDMAALINYALF